MNGRLTALILIAFTAVVTTEAAGQYIAPAGLGIAGTAGIATISPESDVREYGASFEGSLRYTWPSGFQVAGGVNYTLGNVDEVDDSRKVLGIFVDPRLVLSPRAAAVTPYIGARIGYTTHSLNTVVNENDVEITGDGWVFGGIFGVLLRLSDRWAGEVYGVFGVAPLGDVELNGSTVPDSGTTGFTGALRGGLVYSFSPY
jgi:hypothetical protein